MDNVAIHLDSGLNPTGVSRGCPAEAEGPFLATDATVVGCGLLEGHDGPHLFHIEWTDG